MDNQTGNSAPGRNDKSEVFDDILQKTNLNSLRFKDQTFNDFDPEQIAREAATSTAAAPVKKFGKRSARRKSLEPAEPEAVKEAAFLNEEKDPEFHGVSDDVRMQASIMKAQIKAQEEQAAREQTEPYERATFVKPIAAEVVLSTVDILDPEEEEKQRQEDALFARFRDPLTSDSHSDEYGEEDDQDNEEEEEEVIDPGSSLVDDYDYDLYEDKKRYMATDYSKIEEYLARQSRQGYHYVRHDGRKYYFHHGFPRDYYYQILYFADEPPQAQLDLWEEKGWKLLCRAPGKKKHEAGWFVMRNEQQPGSFKQEIENEEEKYRFFRTYSNSCRSTMFMLFICMFICVVMGFLQYYFRGYLYGILFAFGLFVVALWVFLIYGRMLRKSNKQVRLLKAKLRLANSEHSLDFDEPENQKDLDEDWDLVEKSSRK